MARNASSSLPPLKCATETQKAVFDPHSLDPNLVRKMESDALVWSSLHGLIVGDRASQKSGKVPGVGMVHAPTSLLPLPFPESYWKQACEAAPIFNELIDRASLDSKFIQESLSRTKKVDAFTSRLLDIHAKMLDMSKKEDIRLGLHRLDYMLDEQTNLLLQRELNTISSSFPGLSCLVSDLHRFLDNKDEIAKVQRCFAGLWSLEDSRIMNDAIERPELYVMKPQREGGGNNIYTVMM